MMQGDQYRIPVYLEHEDGSSVTEAEVQDVEIFVGSVRKTLSDGVSYDEGEKCFYVHLMQKETFRLIGDVNVQARILFTSGDVVGVDLGTVIFGKSTSKVVLQ